LCLFGQTQLKVQAKLLVFLGCHRHRQQQAQSPKHQQREEKPVQEHCNEGEHPQNEGTVSHMHIGATVPDFTEIPTLTL